MGGPKNTNNPVNPPRKIQKRPHIIVKEVNRHWKKNLLKSIFPIFLIILTLIIIGTFFFLFYKNELIVMHESDLIAGNEIELNKGQELNIITNGENISLKVIKKDSESTTFRLKDNTKISIDTDTTKKLDTDNDGKKDIVIRLNRREDKSIGYFFQEINAWEEGKNKNDEKEAEEKTEEISECNKRGAFSCEGENMYCPSGIMTVSSGEKCCNSRCIDIRKSCKELGGVRQESTTGCSGQITKASDTDYCCITEEIEETTCQELGINCAHHERCGRISRSGAIGCVAKRCEEYGYEECTSREYCNNSKIVFKRNSPDSRYCCEENCQSKKEACESRDLTLCEGKRCIKKETLKDMSGKEFECCESCVQEEQKELRFATDTIHLSGSNKSMTKSDCSKDQYIFFSIISEAALEDIRASVYIENREIYNGKVHEISNNEQSIEKNVFLKFPYNSFISGKEIKIVLDPEQKISEKNENNNILTKTFTKRSLDFAIEYLEHYEQDEVLELAISKTQEGRDCPKIKKEDLIKIKINDEVYEDYTFEGFREKDSTTQVFSIIIPVGHIEPEIMLFAEINPKRRYIENNYENNIIERRIEV